MKNIFSVFILSFLNSWEGGMKSDEDEECHLLKDNFRWILSLLAHLPCQLYTNNARLVILRGFGSAATLVFMEKIVNNKMLMKTAKK